MLTVQNFVNVPSCPHLRVLELTHYADIPRFEVIFSKLPSLHTFSFHTVSSSHVLPFVDSWLFSRILTSQQQLFQHTLMEQLCRVLVDLHLAPSLRVLALWGFHQIEMNLVPSRNTFHHIFSSFPGPSSS